MNITKKMNMDLMKQPVSVTMNAVQNDKYSRDLELSLFADGNPWVIPEEIAVVIRYSKSDGRGGEYDTLPDGTQAWLAAENVLTIHLAPQVLTTPGPVSITVTMIRQEQQISTFTILMNVHPVASAAVTESEDYYYAARFLHAPAKAEAGQYFRVSSVDENGNVTGIETVTLSPDGFAVVCEATGETIELSDATGWQLQGLKVFGNTTQDSVPAPDAPVAMVDAGSGGSIHVSIGTAADDENPQILAIDTPNGLRGIPVSANGNYTDSNGQQWTCDEADLTRGVYVQRVGCVVFDGSEDEQWSLTSTTNAFYRASIKISAIGPESTSEIAPVLCDYYSAASASQNYRERTSIAMSANGTIYIYDPAFNTSDLSLWKAHLAEKPITVLYLMNPVETPGFAEEKAACGALHTNRPTTVITNNVQTGMSVAYVIDLKTYIDNKFAALSAAIGNND